MRDEIRSLQAMRNRLRLRVDELEAEVKTLREETENAKKAAAKADEEVDLIRLVIKAESDILYAHRRTSRCRSGRGSPASKWPEF